MNKKPLVIALLLLAIFGSLAWIYMSQPGRQPQIQMGPYRALGDVAGGETVRLLNSKGSVVIIAHDESGGANPVETAEVKALSDAIKRGGVGLEAIEKFSLPPAARMFGGNVPREWFLHVLQTHPKATAFVLFAEFPVLEQADNDLLKQRGARIVLISGDKAGAQRHLDAGLVQLAIVPRFDALPQGSKPPQSTREWFDRNYMVIAPGNRSASP